MARLEAEALETRERRDLLIPVGLLGEDRIVKNEADPAQKFHAAEFSRLLHRFHAGIGGIVAAGERTSSPRTSF